MGYIEGMGKSNVCSLLYAFGKKDQISSESKFGKHTTHKNALAWKSMGVPTTNLKLYNKSRG